jgi:hypothetical protein
MAMVAETGLIEYRYLNMDHGCYTSERALLDYAGSFRGGIHRAVPISLIDGPVLIAYGTRPYSPEAVEQLDERLQSSRSAD